MLRTSIVSKASRHSVVLRSPTAATVSGRSRVSRRTAVRPVAFQDASRVEQLTNVARDFIECWAEGAKGPGPTDQVLKDILQVTSPYVKVQAVHPMGNIEFKGLAGLRKKMVLDATFKSSMRPNRILLTAADDTQSSVFCLLECEEMGSMDEDVNIVLLELHCVGKTYGIIKLDIQLDQDGSGKVTGVTERMQLGPADTCLLTMLYPEYKLQETMSDDQREEKEIAARTALQLAGTWQFPREHIRAKALKGEALEAAQAAFKAWCDARSSGNDAEALLKDVVDPSFSLWDPYGVLPTVCGIRDRQGKCTYKGIEAESYANCVMPLEPVVDRLGALKETYNIKCEMLSRAICPNHNVGFVHWRSVMCDLVHTARGVVVDSATEYPIEALAVLIFSPDGKIKDTWMLRDPYEAEKDMMQSVCTTGNLVASPPSPLSGPCPDFI